MNQAVVAHFREQAGFCTAYGSPFTGALCERFAEDVEAGGPVAALVEGWSSNPRADVVALRLAGALHAAVLTLRDNKFPNPIGLVRFISQNVALVKVRPDHKIVYMRNWTNPADRLSGARRLLEALAQLAQETA